MWRHNDDSPTLLLLLLTVLNQLQIALAAPQLPSGAKIQEDTGQVTINGDPSGVDNSPSIPNLSIRATIFSGSPGPKSCRGQVLMSLNIPRLPDMIETTDEPSGSALAQCYNLPAPAGCGNFVANKEDGCEVRLFAEPYCRLYMNTAVFIPQRRAVGGSWRSISVRCGVPAPDPATLGAPPLQDMMAKQGMGLGGRAWSGPEDERGKGGSNGMA